MFERLGCRSGPGIVVRFDDDVVDEAEPRFIVLPEHDDLGTFDVDLENRDAVVLPLPNDGCDVDPIERGIVR
jgi:hypothetical protein